MYRIHKGGTMDKKELIQHTEDTLLGLQEEKFYQDIRNILK